MQTKGVYWSLLVSGAGEAKKTETKQHSRNTQQIDGTQHKECVSALSWVRGGDFPNKRFL
jgi:hypothetical protein